MKTTTLFHSMVNGDALKIHVEKNQKRSKIYQMNFDKKCQ